MDGSLRAVRGAILVALATRDAGLEGVVVPDANAREAATAGGIVVRLAHALGDVVRFLQGEGDLQR